MHALEVQVAVVVGGANWFRGRMVGHWGMRRICLRDAVGTVVTQRV